MLNHFEIHWCETAQDAARLATAGMPRLDLEPQRCACGTRVGEVNGTNGDVFWKPCGLVLNGDAIGVICARCFSGVDKALKA